jgi:cytochrome c553
MKYMLLAVSLLLLNGCMDSVDARPLTAAQKNEIQNRITPFSIVSVKGEGVVQVAAIEDLPGKAKYAVCSACHGATGGGGMGPALAGQTVEYITGRLRSYKAGETVGAKSGMMWGQAANLSETDIQDLAEYVRIL